MRGLSSILSFFCSDFNKFNNTVAQMLDSIYHITLKIHNNHIFGVKTSRFCHHLRSVIMNVTALHTNLYLTSGLLILLHCVISVPYEMSCDKDL